VVNNGNAVRSDVDVELDRIGAKLDRTLEGRQCILGEFTGRAAVADPLDAPLRGSHRLYIHRRARQAEGTLGEARQEKGGTGQGIVALTSGAALTSYQRTE
jgi:hypothetical protein